jgi:FkbM family methyltransferase
MTAATQTITPPAWGAYAPKGKRKFLRTLVLCGLARGSLKRWFQRQWREAGPLDPVDIETHGLKFRLHPFDNTTESKLLLASRERDREEFDFLSNHMKPGGAFLDIGANIGFYSLVMIARGAGRALAIEPLPVAFDRLKFNIQANGFGNKIVALQAALGPERSSISIHMTEGDLGGSSIVKADLAGSAVQVQMLPLLDALAENQFTSVDAMKIDVEGFEDSVLIPFYEKAPRSMWPRGIVIEDVHHKNWKTDVLTCLEKLGYRRIARSRSNSLLSLQDAKFSSAD